jgi:mRNA interferase RelE/StbE
LDWTVKLDPRAFVELQKLDRSTQKRITSYLRERAAGRPDPREAGKRLTAEMAGLWRYRIGDYRTVCSINDERRIVLVLPVAHRKDVYR